MAATSLMGPGLVIGLSGLGVSPIIALALGFLVATVPHAFMNFLSDRWSSVKNSEARLKTSEISFLAQEGDALTRAAMASVIKSVSDQMPAGSVLPKALSQLSGSHWQNSIENSANTNEDIESAIQYLKNQEPFENIVQNLGAELAAANGPRSRTIFNLTGYSDTTSSWTPEDRTIARLILLGMLRANHPILIVTEDAHILQTLDVPTEFHALVVRVSGRTISEVENKYAASYPNNIQLSSMVLARETAAKEFVDSDKFYVTTFSALSKAVENAIRTALAVLSAA